MYKIFFEIYDENLCFFFNGKIHHPGSKKQLEEVWEKQDEMEGENFNPRTFFAMHGILFKYDIIHLI